MSLDPGTARHLHHVHASAQVKGRLPSVAAGLVRDGSLLWSDAVGTLDGRADGHLADVDTQYRMGSITKTFVAIAIMRLRDAGELDLLDRFDAYVPGTAFGDVTIAQLLSHGSGLQAETDGPWWERTAGGSWAELMRSSVVQRFRAGRHFHYTNVGYAALGELLARAHGTDWFSVVSRDIVNPLEMIRTTLRPSGRAASGLAVHPFADLLLPEPEHDAGAMAPAGQLWTTVTDLARWAAFLAGDTGGVLSPDSLAEMLEPHTLVDVPQVAWIGAHGLGWQIWNVDGRRSAGHGGSMPGFLAGLRVDLDSGDGVVLLTNTTASTVTADLATDLLAALADREPREPSVWHADASGDAPDVLDILGAWHWGPAIATARFVGEHLILGEIGQGRGARFARVGPDEWVGLDHYYRGEPLHVVRRGDGTVSHLDLATFRFTRTPYDPSADVPGGVDQEGWR